LLQASEPTGSMEFAELEARFRAWFTSPLDLPGTYYLEVVETLYRRNELATGRLIALGKQIDLKTIQAPMFLLAARSDEVVAPAQLFAAERLVGTPAQMLKKETAPCRHLGLFMGKTVLREFWPQIASWLLEREEPIGEHP